MARKSVPQRKSTPAKPTEKELERLVANVERDQGTELPEATSPLIDINAHGTIEKVRDVLLFLSAVQINATDGASDQVKTGLYWIYACVQDAVRYAEAQSVRLHNQHKAVIAAALKQGVRPWS